MARACAPPKSSHSRSPTSTASGCAPARRRLARRSLAICAGSCAASASTGRLPEITLRGDSHYGRPEVMDFCEQNDIDFVFGLSGNGTLDRAVEIVADDIRTRRALAQAPVLRGYAETMYRAKSWSKPRRACARIEATSLGLDIRYVVTSLAAGSAEHIYDTLYCARGQTENLIKMHKGQLASDRTSCRSPIRCASSCTPLPIGSCSRCAMRSPRRTRSQKRSSPPSAYGSSSLAHG